MRFHVEHSAFYTWVSDKSLSIDLIIEKKLLAYARLIHETNKKYNITGNSTIDDIINNLIVGSIEPILRMNVPRGTMYADIGSGAGIPGIPVGIIHNHMKGTLIESNNKKSKFISYVINALQLDNLSVYHGRIEEYAVQGARGIFDVVFSRALGDPYYVIEMGAPLLKRNGLLYIYSHLNPDTMPSIVRDHGVRLGLSIASKEERASRGFNDSGLLFFKKGDTDFRYPRKISIIKRDILKSTT
jgi:16S rRNA (guanine527-N7)-methyltransferase